MSLKIIAEQSSAVHQSRNRTQHHRTADPTIPLSFHLLLPLNSRSKASSDSFCLTQVIPTRSTLTATPCVDPLFQASISSMILSTTKHFPSTSMPRFTLPTSGMRPRHQFQYPYPCRQEYPYPPILYTPLFPYCKISLNSIAGTEPQRCARLLRHVIF